MNSQTPPRSLVQAFYQVRNRGGERVAQQLAHGFEARGWIVDHVAFGLGSEPHPLNEQFEILASGDLRPISIAKATLKLLRRLRAERPDAIIAHTTASGLLAAPVAALAGVRHRIVVHHLPVGTTQGGIWPKLDALLGTIGAYTDVVFVSETAKRSSDGFPARYRRRATVILNGMEPPRPADPDVIRRELAIPHDRPVLLAVGSLTEQKNHRVIIQAMRDHPDLTLVVAGDGDLRYELGELAAEVGEQVLLVGQCSAEQVGGLYALADVMLFPSLWEGRALTLLEAASANLVSICSDIPENRDVLGDAAVYLDAQDVAAWSVAIKEAAGEPATIDAIRPRLAHLELTTLEDMVDDYEALLESADDAGS